MALEVKTSQPVALLAAIKKAIDNNLVSTWSYDTAGDFTHTPNQWVRQAWLRPTVTQGNLMFRIVLPPNIQLTWLIYGVYHGRFIEMLLTHFNADFSEAVATP